jgi:uncharacterized protein YqgC (DUF456 family)
MHWAYVTILYLVLVLLMLGGLALNLMSLPGLWVMLGSTALYAWATGFAYISWPGLLLLLVLCLLAELGETVLGGAAAKKAGGSTRAALGALVGGVLGAFFLTFGLFIIGTIIGAVLGAFLGALAAEWTVAADGFHSARVGYAAAKGRLLATLIKLMFGFVVLIVGLILALPLGGSSGAPMAIPATQPASPATTRPSTTTPSPIADRP